MVEFGPFTLAGLKSMTGTLGCFHHMGESHFQESCMAEHVLTYT